MVFQELAPSQNPKIKGRHDLESELFSPSEIGDGVLPHVRDNEGEAAEHGIYFDDTEYDYMQHIQDLGNSNESCEAFFVEAIPQKKDGKGKAKMGLEDALRESSLQDKGSGPEASGPLDDDMLPARNLQPSTYQSQQNIPDALAGFQPDMDPRLREALEALEDEAYVDDDDDIFGELAKDGEEVDRGEFEELGFEGHRMDDTGWETDETEKPVKDDKASSVASPPVLLDTRPDTADGTDHGDGDWMKEFSKFKGAKNAKAFNPPYSKEDQQSSTMTGTSMIGGRRKKRKGAMTSSTGYSMTSSSLARTEGQSLLDARFDKIEEDYAEDEMDMDDGTASILTGSSLEPSQAPQLTTRSGFDNMMDDFLNGYSMNGKKRLKKGGRQSGVAQLDEVRTALGPARIKAQKV